ncbi:hypothetical protein vseg_017525 [Gypsophila vaccaria]
MAYIFFFFFPDTLVHSLCRSSFSSSPTLSFIVFHSLSCSSNIGFTKLQLKIETASVEVEINILKPATMTSKPWIKNPYKFDNNTPLNQGFKVKVELIDSVVMVPRVYIIK